MENPFVRINRDRNYKIKRTIESKARAFPPSALIHFEGDFETCTSCCEWDRKDNN